MNWKLIKTVFLVLFALVIFVNIHMSLNNYQHNGDTKVICDRKLVLAQLANYYEKLLQRKGINSNTINEAIQENKEKTFDVFDGELNVGKLPETKDVPATLHAHPPDREVVREEKVIVVQGDKKIRNFRLSSSKDVYKGLVVDWWSDICLDRVSWKSVWHPLFPTVPQHTTVALKAEDDDRILGGVYRRLYGYLFFKESSGPFDFQLSSRDGAEVMVMDSGYDINDIHRIDGDIKYNKRSVVLHLRFTKALMDYQDRRIQLAEMFTIDKKGVPLKRNRLYHVEILQGGKHFAKYSLKWRKTGTSEFTVLNKENLCHLQSMSATNSPSILKQKYHPAIKYLFEEDEKRKVLFYNRPVLDSHQAIEESSYKCRPVAKDFKKISYMYQGYYDYVENVVVYPKEYFNMYQTNTAAVTLLQEEAVAIADKVYEKITNIHKDQLDVVDVVHVQSNYNKTYHKFVDISQTYYFVELDVKYKDDDDSKVYRSSHFVKPLPSGEVCFLTDWQWKPNVEINLLTPIRNQLSWFKYLIKMLEEIVEKTKENNVKLVLIDYNSTDGNYQEILKQSKLKHLYLNPVTHATTINETKFNKVKALNYGIKHVADKDSIIFILDLHLQLPLNIFDRIRKLTTQGRTAYNPSLLKLWCGEHEQYTELVHSEWLDYGTGMMAMYKSDWDLIGGFDEEKFGNKWGGEDWEVMDRIVSNGIYIIHQRMPRFYHIHHSKSGMWT